MCQKAENCLFKKGAAQAVGGTKRILSTPAWLCLWAVFLVAAHRRLVFRDLYPNEGQQHHQARSCLVHSITRNTHIVSSFLPVCSSLNQSVPGHRSTTFSGQNRFDPRQQMMDRPIISRRQARHGGIDPPGTKHPTVLGTLRELPPRPVKQEHAVSSLTTKTRSSTTKTPAPAVIPSSAPKKSTTRSSSLTTASRALSSSRAKTTAPTRSSSSRHKTTTRSSGSITTSRALSLPTTKTTAPSRIASSDLKTLTTRSSGLTTTSPSRVAASSPLKRAATAPSLIRRPSSEAAATTERPTEAGAYFVHLDVPTDKELRTVIVPQGCAPGERFRCDFGYATVTVTCPCDCFPGAQVDIFVDRRSTYYFHQRKAGSLTASPAAVECLPRNSDDYFIGGAFLMQPDIIEINEQALHGGASVQTHVITIPPHARPGKKFRHQVGGVRFEAVCPREARPGHRIRIVQPPPKPSRRQLHHPFTVTIPQGVKPHGAFTFRIGSTSTPITFRCPPGKGPGDVIQTVLPIDKLAHSIQLEYPNEKSGGWVRTVRSSDLQFQWVRLLHDTSVIDEKEGFHFFKSAFVRKVQLLEGNDPRLPTGSIELVPAEQAKVESKLKNASDGTTLFSCSEIAVLQGKPLTEKHEWFLETCKKLQGPDDGDYVKINVNRDRLLQDSRRAVLSLSKEEMRRKWRFEFLGERARDEGGPTKEWFELISAELMNPDLGLFKHSHNNQTAVQINPTSSCMLQTNDHLLYFRFVGRVIGKALIDGQLVKMHFTQLIYKHMLGWPVNSKDIADDMMYRSLAYIARASEIPFGLTFTTAEEQFGEVVEKDLVKGGADIAVTEENVDSFLWHCISHHLMKKNLPQLTEILLGFFDVVPEAALTVFDASELELILCGLPEIPIDDWRQSTMYKGCFAETGGNHETVKWFWEVVEEFDQEKRTRLLQFVTGTSGVPANGFQNFRGGDGAIKPFTIAGFTPTGGMMYPRAHTCFNQLDLPIYSSKEDLQKFLVVALTTSHVGFDME